MNFSILSDLTRYLGGSQTHSGPAQGGLRFQSQPLYLGGGAGSAEASPFGIDFSWLSDYLGKEEPVKKRPPEYRFISRNHPAWEALQDVLEDKTAAQNDIDKLKDALKEGDFGKKDLNGAFQRLFAKSGLKTLEQGSVLFSKMVDQGILKASKLLDKTFLKKLDSTRLGALAKGLANAGTVLDSKTANRDLKSWIADHFHERGIGRKFSKELIKHLAKSWVGYYETDEGKSVKSFLKDKLGVAFDTKTGKITSWS